MPDMGWTWLAIYGEEKGKKKKLKGMEIDGARRGAMVVAPKDDKPVEE
jgi:septal ring factor EnvC (AmiA/AmiB activator)